MTRYNVIRRGNDATFSKASSRGTDPIGRGESSTIDHNAFTIAMRPDRPI